MSGSFSPNFNMLGLPLEGGAHLHSEHVFQQMALKTLWGAAEMPFGDACPETPLSLLSDGPDVI
jgi:hypothetical protein